MKKIILDTNALMAVAEFKIDIFTELELCCDFNYKIYVLEGTIKELNKIAAEQKGKYKRAAKLALSLIKAKKVPLIKSKIESKIKHKDENVDDELVKHSQQGSLVLTQDIALKRRLIKPYLTIRQKKKVMVVG